MASISNPAYESSTPDRRTFTFEDAVLLSPHVSYIPAPTTSTDARASHYARGRRWLLARARRSREVFETNIGLLLVGCAQLFLALMNVGVKKLNSLDPPVPAAELIFVRMAITWICCVTYMYTMNVPDPVLGPKAVRWFLVQRGFFGFIGIFCLYYSLQYLSLSDATVLQFLSPMFTAIASAVFLHETFSMRESFAGLVSLVGVVLIARPSFLFGSENHGSSFPPDKAGLVVRAVGALMAASNVSPSQRLTAVCVSLFGAVGAAGAYTTIRHIGKRAHALHNLVAYSALCVIVSTIAMIGLKIPVVVPMRWDWLLVLLLIGIFGFGGQVLLTMGLQRETAGRGTIAVYAQIVFASIFERIVFNTTPSPLSIVGTIIIVGSALYVVLTKEGKQSKTPRAVSSDDPSVEEGLLHDHVDEQLELEGGPQG